MPSSRHENSVDRVAELGRQLGHQRWTNTQDGGKDGYKFDPIVCPDGKIRPFIADCLLRTKGGAMVNIEVDYNHETKLMKVATLARFGVATVKVDPSGVDLWVKEPSLMDAEIEYALRNFDQKV